MSIQTDQPLGMLSKVVQDAIKSMGEKLAREQSYVFHQSQKLKKSALDFPFENGKIQGLREGLFSLGCTAEQINAMQWDFEDKTEK
jgi:hypothetical protein